MKPETLVRLLRQHPEKLERVLRRIHGQQGVSAPAFDAWNTHRVRLQAVEATAGEILIYGLIVSEADRVFYEECLGDTSYVSAVQFRKDLEAIEGDVTLRINSDGGDAFEASTMRTAIQEREKSGTVTAIVDGMAASAASIVAVSCSDVAIADMGQVMIHCGSSWMYGNAQDFTKAASFLTKLDTSVAAIYAGRMTDTSTDEALQLMQAETFFSAAEAIEKGLADRLAADSDEPAGADMARSTFERERSAAVSASLFAAA